MRTPAQDRERWHTEAREGDEARLASGPVDDCESDDPWHPWRGPDPAVSPQVDAPGVDGPPLGCASSPVPDRRSV